MADLTLIVGYGLLTVGGVALARWAHWLGERAHRQTTVNDATRVQLADWEADLQDRELEWQRSRYTASCKSLADCVRMGHRVEQLTTQLAEAVSTQPAPHWSAKQIALRIMKRKVRS